MSTPHNHFDGLIAERYDDPTSPMYSAEVLGPTVDFLAELADGRPALELAIGTGRVALPLSERGVEVSGIELSEAMVAQLRKKPGSEHIDVTVGDMAHTRVPGEFGLVYLVFNTINNVLTQDEQVACFENAAAHLVSGGSFVIEVGVPKLQRIPVGERYYTSEHTDGHVCVDEYDVVTHEMWSHHYTLEGTTYRRNSVPFRYVWPAELDLMARVAGMRPVGWDRSDFTATSRSHVSVWQL